MEKLPQKVPSKWKNKRALGRLLLKTFMGPSKPKMVCYGKKLSQKERANWLLFLFNIYTFAYISFPFVSISFWYQ